MIIASSEKLIPGKVYSQLDFYGKPFSANDTWYYYYTFMCLRVAKLNEYIDECHSLNYDDHDIMDYILTRPYYYEISLD